MPSIYAIIINEQQDRANTFTTSPSFVIKLSLGNFGRKETFGDDEQLLMYTQSFIHMACIVALWFMSLCLRGLQKKLEIDIDANATTPNDYAVYMRHIPLKQDEAQIK